MLMLLLPLVVKDFICWNNLKSKALAYLHLILYSKLSSSIKFLYALPVYYGYLTQGQKGVLQRVLDRATIEASLPITMIWMC